MKKIKRTIYKIIILFYTFGKTLSLLFDTEAGGGRLLDPPGRGSLWRFNYTDVPVNTEDYKSNCGGVERHWFVHNGKCGICGDPWDGPRDHEVNGKFYTDIISRTYKQNSVIKVTVETLSNSYGWFEFRVYPHAHASGSIEQFTPKNYLLQIGDTGKTRFRVWESGYHVIPLTLPENFTCHKCLLQWKYHTGNLWGCDDKENERNCCYGCGNVQSEYYGCADISIEASPDPEIDALMFNSFRYGISAYKRWWCNIQCIGEECSTSFCRLTSKHGRLRRSALKCRGTGVWNEQPSMHAWCKNNCVLGNCPKSHCVCHVPATSTATPVTTQGKSTTLTTTTSKTGFVPGIVRVLQSRGCEYCRHRNDDTCKEYYCPGYNVTHVGFQGSLYDKVSKLSEYFCSTCNPEDTVCRKLFCGPEKLMVGLGIYAKCQFCRMVGDSTCLSNPECSGLSTDALSKSDPSPSEASSVNVTKRQNCVATNHYANIAGMNKWCENNCNNSTSKVCFPNQCRCTDTTVPKVEKLSDSSRDHCFALGLWRGQAPMNAWCTLNCAMGHCPTNMCKCGSTDDKTTIAPQTTTTLPRTTSRTTTTTPTTTVTFPSSFTTNVPHQGVDTYSLNSMNGIMCGICKSNPLLYQGCSTKFCNLYNSTAEPPDTIERVLNFSPALFCGLPGKEALFCKPKVLVTPFVQSTICAACVQLSPTQSCDRYCQS